MVVPETPYPVEPYSGGTTSYMKISTLSNNYDVMPSWSYHVVAHELHPRWEGGRGTPCAEYSESPEHSRDVT